MQTTYTSSIQIIWDLNKSGHFSLFKYFTCLYLAVHIVYLRCMCSNNNHSCSSPTISTLTWLFFSVEWTRETKEIAHRLLRRWPGVGGFYNVSPNCGTRKLEVWISCGLQMGLLIQPWQKQRQHPLAGLKHEPNICVCVCVWDSWKKKERDIWQQRAENKCVCGPKTSISTRRAREKAVSLLKEKMSA